MATRGPHHEAGARMAVPEITRNNFYILYPAKGIVSYRHKRTAWGCRGCGRIPNAEKLAIIRAKIFKIWEKYTAAFTC